jgi:universal stress protein A
MSVYRYVLAVVDLGEASTKVLRHAAFLVKQCDAKLTVLHVVNYYPSSDVDYVLPPDDAREQKLIDVAQQNLQELLEREALNDMVDAIVISGRPRVEILRYAERQKTDLIVIGAHSRHIPGAILGSTTDGVLHRATCDVLTVR